MGFVAFTIVVMVIVGIGGYAAVWGIETLLARYQIATADSHMHDQR